MSLPTNLPDLPATLLIGIGNKARQGKDLFAGYLSQALRAQGVTAKCYSFADALYHICRADHGMTTKDPVLLQNVGMDYRRLDPNVWVRSCLWRISDDPPQVAIIPDARFRNEAEVIKLYGGVTIQVVRTRPDGARFIDPSRPADHPSEVDNDGWAWDMVIENNSTMDALRDRAMVLADRFVNSGYVALTVSR
jgi:hypothetical protein